MRLRLVYTPDGGISQQFEFDADNPLSLEAEALEGAGGEVWADYADWLLRVGSGNIRARRALLWVGLRRTQPELRFSDVVFHLNEFAIEDADEEPEPVGKGSDGDSSTGSPSPTPDSEPSPSS
jgi:hypothetical protein